MLARWPRRGRPRRESALVDPCIAPRQDIDSVTPPATRWPRTTNGAPLQQLDTPWLGQPSRQGHLDSIVDGGVVSERFNECRRSDDGAREGRRVHAMEPRIVPAPSSPGPACVRRSQARRIACGPAGDGCELSLDCGTCKAPSTCGGAGVHSECVRGPCTLKSCADLAITAVPPVMAARGGSGNRTAEARGGGGVSGVCGAAYARSPHRSEGSSNSVAPRVT